jgi:hypothetical protein
MGLITGLLTLPLAPIRGTIWIAEQVAEQAEAELNDDSTIRSSWSSRRRARPARSARTRLRKPRTS